MKKDLAITMADFGGQLRAAREQRGISLRDIAIATKISMVTLEALERNDFSRLPGGIFSRAFVRAYALEVGLDADKTVQDFLVEADAYDNAIAEKAPPPVTADDRAFLARQRRAAWWLRAASLGAFLAIVAVFLGWQLTPRTKAPAAPDTSTAAAASATTAAGAQPSQDPNAPAPPAEPPPGPDQVALRLQTTDDCWVRVTVDGTLLFEQVLASGEIRDVKPGREVYVQVGNAGAVKWSINGKTAKDMGKAGQPATARVSRATLAKFLQ